MDYSPLGSSVHGFPRQEYWSGLGLGLGDLLDPGIEPGSPAIAGRFFTVWALYTSLVHKTGYKGARQLIIRKEQGGSTHPDLHPLVYEAPLSIFVESKESLKTL